MSIMNENTLLLQKDDDGPNQNYPAVHQSLNHSCIVDESTDIKSLDAKVIEEDGLE